jgi:hypothetical protein
LQTINIWYENLAAMVVNDRRPLSELALDRCIHGGLRIQIAGRLVPYLGYWGPDDVCFGEWVGELGHAAKAMKAPGGRHVYDEGEQGQPAFVFEREGDRGFFSIVASEISGASGDVNWQRIEFAAAQFITSQDQLRATFFAEVRAVAPSVADTWLERRFRQ